MNQGTKLGDKDQNKNFDESVTDKNLAPTKIGEVSEFEKSLGLDKVRESTEKSEDLDKDNKVSEENKKTNPEIPSNQELFEQQLMSSINDYEEGDIITGKVTKIEKKGIYVDINYKSEGFITSQELGAKDKTDNIKLGDNLDVYIEKLENKQGYTILSRKKALYEQNWEDLSIAAKQKEKCEVKVVSAVQGGLVVEFDEIKGFIPASQVKLDEGETLSEFVKKSLTVVPLHIDRKRRKVIFSHKQAEIGNAKENTVSIDSFEMGQTRLGKVTSIKDFGIFVDLGGIEGMAHVSELSWSRIKHPSELVNVGEEVDVFILGVNKATGRISLGLKQLQEDPWTKVTNKYSLNQIIDVTVTRVVTFGIFAELDDEIEGLIHISELSKDRINNIQEFAKKGDVLKVKIIKIAEEEQKIGLSIKQLDNNVDSEFS